MRVAVHWQIRVVVTALAVATVLIVGQLLPGTWMGVDQAAYLLTLRELLGGDSREAWSRPPLAPGFLLWPFVAVLGDRLGLIVFSAVLTIPVVCAAYFYARSHDLSPEASLAVAAATGLEPVMSGTTIGGPIILTPIASILFGAGLVIRVARGDHIPAPIFLLFGIVPWLNQTYAVIAPAALLVIALGQPGFLRRMTRHQLWACAGAVLIAAPSLLWYGDVAPWSNHMSGGQALELLPLAVNPAVVLFYPALALAAATWIPTRRYGLLSIAITAVALNTYWVYVTHEVLWNLIFRPMFLVIPLMMPAVVRTVTWLLSSYLGVPIGARRALYRLIFVA